MNMVGPYVKNKTYFSTNNVGLLGINVLTCTKISSAPSSQNPKSAAVCHFTSGILFAESRSAWEIKDQVKIKYSSKI